MRLKWFYITAGLLLVSLGGFLATKPSLLEEVPFSRAVFDNKDRLLRLTLAQDEQYRLYVPLDKISPRLRDAVLLHEDRYFYNHFGVNPAAMMRAFWQTYVAGARRVGASTLSMQVARLRFRIHSRHLPGKLWQMLRALQLELHYSKDELLEAYFNLAPYGYNVEGIGAASLIYFHKTPDHLSLPEALTLAVVPQSPARRRPSTNNLALREARNRLWQRWQETHPQDKTHSLFFTLPLAVYNVNDLPKEAPHFSNFLLAKEKTRQIHTTLDLDIQQNMERVLTASVRDMADIGIHNASALLVDVRNMQVVASIGSADFNNKAIHGQVDGTRARRSPGSALKPFIYALAFQQGLIHPYSILADAPKSFGSYAPDNFDRDFRGPIPAAEALRMSRNVPAIQLASNLKKTSFYELLQMAGIGKLQTEKEYGLSLVLGGAEVTMQEMAMLYAMLANSGRLQPLLFEQGKKPANGKRLLSAEASFLTLDALRDTVRPPNASHNSVAYWKTGTSNGFHDAWTAGVFGHYVLVVWVGNFNGNGNPSLIGVRAAAPLFFQLIDVVRQRDTQNEDIVTAQIPHVKIRRIMLCASTGDMNIKNCPSIVNSWFIPGVSPIREQNILRNFLINNETGKRACQFDAVKTSYQAFEVWPSDLKRVLDRTGIYKNPLPQWEEGCVPSAQQAGEPPRILSPLPNIAYQFHVGASLGNKIPFKAAADGEVKTLHWFVNKRYIGVSQPDVPLLWDAEPGNFRVSVVDDHGHSAHVNIAVQISGGE